MSRRWLPPGAGNKFQRIKEMCRVAESNGIKIWRLSIGQPSGPALLSARVAASQAVMSAEESMHEYQDNGSPGVPDFARRFVAAHVPNGDLGKMAFLPIPGIKPMLGMVLLACGSKINHRMVFTMTDPGYPTPADQCRYLGLLHDPLLTNPENEFVISIEGILGVSDILMLNYPHNPSGQIATRVFWEGICAQCEKSGIRLFNDAAYIALAHDPSSCSLSEVATNFPNLSWAEAFSSSKLIGNGTGWRIGSMAGSPDFIADIAEVKGNTDSGFFAPAAQGVITALETERHGIEVCRLTYAKRIKQLIGTLNGEFGMRLAVEPKAGFFTLWKTPYRAFDQKIVNAEEFNNLMIEHTGIVGVPFGEYIRYAVTSPIEKPEWQSAIREGFKKANLATS